MPPVKQGPASKHSQLTDTDALSRCIAEVSEAAKLQVVSLKLSSRSFLNCVQKTMYRTPVDARVTHAGGQGRLFDIRARNLSRRRLSTSNLKLKRNLKKVL